MLTKLTRPLDAVIEANSDAASDDDLMGIG